MDNVHIARRNTASDFPGDGLFVRTIQVPARREIKCVEDLLLACGCNEPQVLPLSVHGMNAVGVDRSDPPVASKERKAELLKFVRRPASWGDVGGESLNR